MRFPAFLVLCLTFCQPHAARADDWQVPRGPAREPVPYRYDPKVWATVPKAFLEDASACILYSGTTYQLEADGTVEATTHEITRLAGRSGIENLGEYRHIAYDPTYQKLTLNEARVHKQDGSVVKIEPRHLHLRDSGTDYQTYDPSKLLVISFPNLAVGDVYEVKWTVRGKDREFGEHFFARYTFGDDRYPIVKDELHVILPEGKKLQHASINGKVTPKISETGGRRHFHWSVEKRPALPRDEEGPSKEELRLQVAISTYASWDEVARWKQQLRADCWKCTPAVRQVIDEVSGKLTSPLEKARALTYWVRKHVRYISRGPDGRGYTPHTPSKVLANLYGDCKDQTQLLAVMFKEIGLDPWLVTIGALDDGQIAPDVPSPWGSHALVMVPIGGKEYWIDTTVAQAAWDYLPRGDRDRQAYMTRGKELRLVRTPSLTYRDNRIEQTTVVTVQGDGTARCLRYLYTHGSSALSRRNDWLETPPGERRRLMTAELQNAFPKARLVDLKIKEDHLVDFDKPVQAQVEFLLPRHFDLDSKGEGSFTDSPIWSRLLSYQLDVERRLPLQLAAPFESVHLYVVHVPTAFRIAKPPRPRHIVSPWGSFELKVDRDAKNPRRLEFSLHTRLEKVRVDKADFARFQRFQDDIHDAYRIWITVEETTALADAPALEALWALMPGADVHSARVLAQVYLHQGKPADARRILASARWHRPAQKKLWELSIKAAANNAEKEKLYVEMVQRFPLEIQYEVALGEVRIARRDFAGARAVLEPLTKTAIAKAKAEAHYHLARADFLEQAPAKALIHLEAAARADPHILDDSDRLSFKAQVHERLGRTKEALQAYRDAVVQDDKDQEALAALIQLEIRADLKNDALDHLRSFVVAASKNGPSLAQAADLSWQLMRLDDALELAKRSRDMGFHAGAQRILGLVHARKGDHAQAIFHFDRAELNAEARCALARAHLSMGQLTQAAKAVQEGQAVPQAESGWDVELHKIWLAAQELVKRRDALLDRLKASREQLAASTTAVEALVCAEKLFADKAPLPQVESLLARALELKAACGPAFALRGQLHLERGQLTKALADAQRALELGPEEARGNLVRGRVKLERNDLAGANADLLKAVELSGRRDPWALHFLALAQAGLGDQESARASQREAIRLAPGEAAFREPLPGGEAPK